MDNSEFKRIAEKYLDTVYRVAINSCRNAADAEDIVQNTFIKLLERKKDFRDDEHVKQWLIRVAVNEGYLLWRKRKRESPEPLEEIMTFREELRGSILQLADKRKRISSAVSKALLIAAAIVLCFGVSNLITYAVSGNAWVVGTWHRIFGNVKYSGEDYPMEQVTYIGNGFTIQIETAVLGEPGQPSSLSLGGNSEGVNVIRNEGGIFLVFGENEIDLTRQIEEIPMTDNYICAAGTIMLGERKVVYIVKDREQFYRRLEKEHGSSLPEHPRYQVSFFDYDTFTANYMNNGWLGEQFIQEIEDTETFIAK